MFQGSNSIGLCIGRLQSICLSMCLSCADVESRLCLNAPHALGSNCWYFSVSFFITCFRGAEQFDKLLEIMEITSKAKLFACQIYGQQKTRLQIFFESNDKSLSVRLTTEVFLEKNYSRFCGFILYIYQRIIIK